MTQLNFNFNKLSAAAFLAQAQRIATAMTGNPGFPEPWPSTVPTLAQIQADLAAYQDAVNDTAAGNRTRIVERNSARDTLATDLSRLAFNVQTVAQGDASLLATTGFPLRQRSPRTQSPQPLPAPEGFRIARGTLSGTVVASAARLHRAGSYDVQITTADPTVETSWTAAGSFTSCRRMELTDLTPVKVYYVRMRGLGAAGPGAWTTPSSVMVL